jgi:hypothetical protein
MKVPAIITITTALGILATPSPSWSKGDGHGVDIHPCDLTGVNPAHHGRIFDNPAVAKSFGFEKGPDGTWHLMANCQATGPK